MLPTAYASGDGPASRNTAGGLLSPDIQVLPSAHSSQDSLPIRELPGLTPASPRPLPRRSFDVPRNQGNRPTAIGGVDDYRDEPVEVILQSFFPAVAVYASPDTEELVRFKGISGGFWGLLKPFGEKIQGKVVIRDSVGASKSWDNFGLRFIEPGKGLGSSQWNRHHNGDLVGISEQRVPTDSSGLPEHITEPIDHVMNHYIREKYNSLTQAATTDDSTIEGGYYAHYLRKILSDRLMVAHEPFSHPVACVVAISSQSAAPIETLRDLYSETTRGERRIPEWASNDFLRYYVLVHDEEHDDIVKSTALFEQMKRHFGLHCHLLRLKGTECSSDQPEAMAFPSYIWTTADDELMDIHQRENYGRGDLQPFIFESDATALRIFVREMTTQSIVPFMESRVMTWNDQVASRRRGISGRFMSLSKRWTGFGTTRGTKTPPNGTSSGGSNYNTSQGFYASDSPEAIMHRLADYAFILRDWKLSASTYEILRTDFGDDKVWKYHAIVSEMAAVSLLLVAPITGTRSRLEDVNKMLDAASYSYINRCSNPNGAIRCLVLAIELLRSRGGAATEEAAKWGSRVLEMSLMSPLTRNLIVERVAICYSVQSGTGNLHWGSRSRKGAFWNLLASEAWLSSGNVDVSRTRMQDAGSLYGISTNDGKPPFPAMQDLWDHLSQATALKTSQKDIDLLIDEESEQLDTDIKSRRLSGVLAAGASLPTARRTSFGDPLGGLSEDPDAANDGFV